MRGGFTVPQQFATDLLTAAAELAIVRPRALNVPTTAPVLHLPVPDQTAVPTAGVSPFFGGLNLQWGVESAQLSQNEPTFRNVTLEPRNLTGYGLIARRIWDDAPAFERWFTALLVQAIAWFEDYAFLRGSGVTQPLGILNSAALLTVSRSAGNTIAAQDLSSMLAKLLPGSLPHACWAFSQTALAQLMRIGALECGGGERGPEWHIAGLPAYATEKLPVLGTSGDLLLFDGRFYAVATRTPAPLAIGFSHHVAFRTSQVAFRVFYRVDGQPTLRTYVTLQDATTQASPFVVLS